MPNHVRKFSQSSAAEAATQPPRPGPKLEILKGGRTKAEEEKRALHQLRREEAVLGLVRPRREMTDEEAAHVIERRSIAQEELGHLVSAQEAEKGKQAPEKIVLFARALERQRNQVLTEQARRETAEIQRRAQMGRETAEAVHPLRLAREEREGEHQYAEREEAAKAEAREMARAESGEYLSIQEVFQQSVLSPAEAYRLAEFQMKRMNPEAQVVAKLVEAADEARVKRIPGGRMIMVENPFRVPTVAQERVELQDGKAAWGEKRKEIVGQIGTINAALNKLKAEHETLVGLVDVFQMPLTVFAEQGEGIKASLEAMEEIVRKKRRELQDRAHPSNLDVKSSALREKIEKAKGALEDARAKLKKTKISAQKKDALAEIGMLEFEQIEAKNELRRYQGSAEQKSDMASREQDLADERARLEADLAEAELGVSVTKDNLMRHQVEYARKATNVDQWRERERVDSRLMLHENATSRLMDKRNKLEQQLRWIDDVHIRQAAFEEIARAYGKPVGGEKNREEDVPVPGDEDLKEAA